MVIKIKINSEIKRNKAQDINKAFLMKFNYYVNIFGMY